MKRILILIIVVLVVVTASGFVGLYEIHNESRTVTSNNGSSGKANNFKIISLTVTPDIYESSLFYISQGESFPRPLYINATAYSITPATFALYILTPNGDENISLGTYLVNGLTNISYPQKPSQFWDIYAQFTEAGNYTIYGSLYNSTIVLTAKRDLIVNPPIHIKNVIVEPSPPIQNTTSRIALSVSGGVPPYSIFFNISSPSGGYEVLYGQNRTFIFNQSGQWVIGYSVSDSVGAGISGSTNVDVQQSALYVKYRNVDVGVTDIFSLNTSYSGTPNEIKWTDYTTGKVISNNRTVNLSFDVPGIQRMGVVDYSSEGKISYNFSVRVYPQLHLINITQKYAQIDPMIDDYYFINLSGGAILNNSLKVSYYVNSTNAFNMNLSNISTTDNFYTYFYVYYYPSPPYGPMQITVYVSDDGGMNISTNFTLILNPPISANISIPSNITINETVILNAFIEGGTAPYNYTWNITLPNFTTLELFGKSISLIVNETGYYSVELTVRDYFGRDIANMYSYVYAYSSFTVS
jgi:hypothetical protein